MAVSGVHVDYVDMREMHRGETYVDPEPNQPSNLPSQFINTNQTTSNRRGRQFRDINRRQIRARAHAQTSQDTSGIHDPQPTITVRAQHQPGSQGKDNGRNPETPFPAPEEANGVCEEGAEESPGLIQRHDVGLDQILLALGPVPKVKLIAERVQFHRLANKGTVITDHTRGTRSDGRKNPNTPVIDLPGGRPVLNHGKESHDGGLGGES